MDRTMTFFRVFDLAFFAPGAVIVLFFVLGYGPPLESLPRGDSVAFGVLTMVALALCSYVVGVATFSLHRWVREAGSRLRDTSICRRIANVVANLAAKLLWQRNGDTALGPMKSQSRPSMLYLLRRDPRRPEILLYFWYLRATCWNLGLALLLCALATRMVEPAWGAELRDDLAFWLLLCLAGLIYRQGEDYHQTLQEAAFQSIEPQSGSDK